ncbi:MAG: recombinase A [Deltaproteobacteria bacterium]|nr:recombinase A [Deltaproteobacteria bacterium]
MPVVATKLEDLVAARYLRPGAAPCPSAQGRWCRNELSGRLVELCGSRASAQLTAAFGLVLDAQRSGETAAWVTTTASSFFPPDAAEGGIDLDTLAVVRVPRQSDVARAADKLIRSGAFGLVVLDLTSAAADPRQQGPRERAVPDPLLARLLGLARQHDTAVVLLAVKDRPLGSLVSLRVEARRRVLGSEEGGRAFKYEVGVCALKDKRREPGWTHAEVCHGPAGLR